MKTSRVVNAIHGIGILAITLGAVSILFMADRDLPTPEEAGIGALVVLMFLAVNSYIYHVITSWYQDVIFWEKMAAQDVRLNELMKEYRQQ